MSNADEGIERLRRFYDDVYYRDAVAAGRVTAHHRRLARRLGIARDQQVLDVACGTGGWLLAAHRRGAKVAGIDVSAKAVEICRGIMPEGEFHAGPAETLPFADRRFDVVTCLGSLEHFLDKDAALAEIVRVAKDAAAIVLLVPNAGFLTRRLGLFRGTQQASVREDVLSLAQWQAMFERNGLEVVRRWKDLHVLSWHWIRLAGWRMVPARLTQALLLAVWPLGWQYQVYFLCRGMRSGRAPAPAATATPGGREHS